MLDSDLLKFNLKDRKFIFYDFENCEGLHTFYSRPHELSWVETIGDQVVEKRQYYIKWPKPWNISKAAAQITRFNENIVDQRGVEPKHVFEEFSSKMFDPEYWNIGANTLNYDCMLFYNSCKKLGLRHDWSFLNRCYDVNALYKMYKLDRKINNDDLLAMQFSANNFVRKGFKSNVGLVAREFGVEIDENKQHEGAYDAEKEMEIFFQLIKKINLI